VSEFDSSRYPSLVELSRGWYMQDSLESLDKTAEEREDRVLWRPLSPATVLRQANRSRAAQALLLVWALLTVLCVVLGVYQVKLAWNALPVHLGPIRFSVTVYPPLVICLWMLFWLGFEWAFLSAYLATFWLAVYSGMVPGWALLFALVDPLSLAVYALAYRTARIPFDLRSVKSVLWYLLVSFLAAVAGSIGSFIWSGSHRLSPVDTFAIWQGWWVGTLLQAIFLNGPILAILGRQLEQLKASHFGAPPRPRPSGKWIIVAISAGGLVVAGFLLATGELASARLAHALAGTVSEATRLAVEGAVYSWKLTVWTGIVLTLAGSLGGIFLAYSWNRSLIREVQTRTIELNESEQRFRVTFEQAAVGIAHVAQDGRWLRVNQKLCDIVGYSRAELLQKTFQDITHPEDLNADLENVRKMLAGEIQTYSMQKRYIQKQGTLVWINLTVALARGSHGESRYFISIVEDITERKHLEEELRQSQKMEAIGRLAGGVAHDFNNLLTVIGGYGHMLREQMEENIPLREKAEAICQASDRAAALTKQLLAFSRRQVVQLRIVDLNDTVAGMEEMLRRLLGADIELTTVASGSPARVKADPGQIEQVIVNLAVNAKDAMPEGGQLCIKVGTVETDGMPQVTFAVQDTGEGMDAEVQSHLFEPFYTTKAKGKGTGLGLSIVYGIVRQAGGSINVSSLPGQGASFEIFLPRVTEAPAQVAVGEATSKTVPGSETILLVEDETALRKLASETLRASGYTVLEAATGEDALNIWSRSASSIHLLVTDIIMPAMNGRTLAERLRSARPEVKVLFISGYSENILDPIGPLDSTTAFLQKPFAPAALTEKVRELLD
jgi:PAS domain S-box-containing protein